MWFSAEWVKGEASTSIYADWWMGNDFRNLSAKVRANLDHPIKSNEFSPPPPPPKKKKKKKKKKNRHFMYTSTLVFSPCYNIFLYVCLQLCASFCCIFSLALLAPLAGSLVLTDATILLDLRQWVSSRHSPSVSLCHTSSSRASRVTRPCWPLEAAKRLGVSSTCSRPANKASTGWIVTASNGRGRSNAVQTGVVPRPTTEVGKIYKGWIRVDVKIVCA